jgi:hypothetical protein
MFIDKIIKDCFFYQKLMIIGTRKYHDYFPLTPSSIKYTRATSTFNNKINYPDLIKV